MDLAPQVWLPRLSKGPVHDLKSSLVRHVPDGRAKINADLRESIGGLSSE